MKVSVVLSFLLFFISCTHRPSSRDGNPVAYDSIANGKIKATAMKQTGPSEVCFDITLNVSGVDQKLAEASNWSLAWVDGNATYRLMSLIQRDPASSPQGHGKNWTNTFRTCATKHSMNDVTSLILTPKEIPFEETQGLNLKWQ
jgi:hypothetical protein